MDKYTLTWHLIQKDDERVLRHCHNCGKPVLFRDSKKRRQNANGKTVYRYAIFKCENGHSWNKMLHIGREYQTYQDGCLLSATESETISIFESISILDKVDAGVLEIEIVLARVEGKWRLDKALGMQIKDISRTRLERLIAEGAILLEDAIVKPGTMVKTNQRIRLNLTLF